MDKGIADMHFPNAIQIVDLYHAREHVCNLCKILFCDDEKVVFAIGLRWWTYLDWGMVEKIIKEARRKIPENQKSKKDALKEISYLEKTRNGCDMQNLGNKTSLWLRCCRGRL